MEPILNRLSTGYYRLSWNPQQWAQWPVDRQPTKEDCFTEETWPLVESWLRQERRP
jgi:hypothetical protein